MAIVGDVPTGFQFVSLSSISASDLVALVPGALAIVIVGLAQSLAIAKSYAARYHYAVDANREMLGYGAANIGAGALQGYTVTGGLSPSATAERVGAKSPVAFLVTALMALLTILFLAGLFADLPEAILGAIVIWAVSGMIDFGRVTQYRRAQSLEFWAALGALLGVVLINILPGVAIGVALSFILLIHTIDHPHIASLGRSSDGSRFSDLEDDTEATPIPGVLIHRFEAALIFANADIFQDDLLARVRAAEPSPKTVILDFEAVEPDRRDGRADAAVGPRHPRRARHPADRRAREEQRARRAASQRDHRRPRRAQPRADRRRRRRGRPERLDRAPNPGHDR